MTIFPTCKYFDLSNMSSLTFTIEMYFIANIEKSSFNCDNLPLFLIMTFLIASGSSEYNKIKRQLNLNLCDRYTFV